MRAATPGFPRWPGPALLALLAVASLDRGGAGPTGLLLWHGGLVLLLLAVYAGRGRGADRLPPGPLAGFAAFCAVALVGAFRAPYGYAAWLGLLELAAFLAAAALAARCGRGLPRRLVDGLLLLGAGHAVVLLIQRFVLQHERSAGGFLNPNHVAGWLAAILLLAWGTTAEAPRGLAASRRALRVAASLPIAAALVATGSRGSALGLAVGVTAALVLLRGRLGRGGRRWALIVALVGLVLVGSGVAWRLGRSDPFRYQRLGIWRACAEFVSAHPLTGSGPRQFAVAARAFQFPDGDGPLRYDRRFARPHSDLLRVPCELGLPGLVALAVTLVAAGRELRTRRRAGEPGIPVGVAAALGALAAQATVENLSETPAIYLLVAVLAGSTLSVRREPRHATAAPAVRAACAVVLLTVFVVGDLAPYLAWARTRGLPPGRLDPPGLARLDRALALNRLQPDYRRRLAEHHVGGGSDWNLERYVAAREAAEHAVRLHPAAAEFTLALARIEGLACRTLFRGDDATRERAARAYERAAGLDPSNATIPLEQAAALLDCGAADEAVSAAERALDLEPEAVAPRLVLAGALVAADAPGARARAERLISEAAHKAERWSEWVDTGPLARALLRFDPAAVERVRAAAAAASTQ